MKRYAFTLISALLVSLALPVGVAHADAATVSVNAGVISFTAPVDRGVDLRVWVDALGRYAFKDSAGQLAGGEGCIAINAQKVVCDAAADFLEVDGSTFADTIRIEPGVAISNSISGDDGNDVLVGALDTRVEGGPG